MCFTFIEVENDARFMLYHGLPILISQDLNKVTHFFLMLVLTKRSTLTKRKNSLSRPSKYINAAVEWAPHSRNAKLNTRRSAHSSKYRYLLSPPQRPLCHGEAGEKEKESARGTNRPRVFYFFVYCYCYRATQEPPRRKQRLPLQAQVQCRIQTLR